MEINFTFASTISWLFGLWMAGILGLFLVWLTKILIQAIF